MGAIFNFPAHLLPNMAYGSSHSVLQATMSTKFFAKYLVIAAVLLCIILLVLLGGCLLGEGLKVAEQ